MVMFILGALLFGVGGVLDSVFRLRMSRIGQRWALLQGGAFDYSRYHKVREEHGWAAWPVHLMWVAWVSGIALLIAGCFSFFGTRPMRQSAITQLESHDFGSLMVNYTKQGRYDDAFRLAFMRSKISQAILLQGDQVTLEGRSYPFAPLRRGNDKILADVKGKAAKAGCPG